MSRRDSSYFERQNLYFVQGQGINGEVLQKEICRYLGPKAYARPSVVDGVEGYAVTAVRPFTPEMLDELKELSNDYERKRGVAALSYEDFEACRREETAFAKSGTGYTYSQGGCQTRSSYPTTSPWPGYPPPHASITNSERSNHAEYSAYWSPAGVNCQQDLTRDSDITQAISRTNALGRRQNDRQGIDNPFSQGSLDTQGRGYAPSQERAYSYTNSHSSDYSAVYGSPQYTMSCRDAYRSQSKDSMLCSSCQEQARRGPNITLCRVCRLKILDSCDESSSSYDFAVAMVASMLVGVVAGGLIIKFLRR